MNINIFGSTGEIGTKTLNILKKYFPNIKINLLVANNNYKKIINQIIEFKPKYVYLQNPKHLHKLRSVIKDNKTKLLLKDELEAFLSNSVTDLTILSISGYEALYYLKILLNNTNHLGLVNKETIVSAGHLFKKIIKNKKLKIYPLDSEHYSLNSFFNGNNHKSYNHIYLTATGGPFLYQETKNVSFMNAIKHPKWKMGYKNSVDSATLVNKCLEIIEAHYLFNIPFNKIDIVIHPEAYVHSIIEFNNLSAVLNSFYPDMFIPIFNFLKESSKSSIIIDDNKYKFSKKNSLNFMNVQKKKFPIYDIFKRINKNSPKQIIKFNCSNEIAVENFKSGKIKFQQIHEFIDNSLSLDFNHPINTLDQVIDFQKYYKIKLCK